MKSKTKDMGVDGWLQHTATNTQEEAVDAHAGASESIPVNPNTVDTVTGASIL